MPKKALNICFYCSSVSWGGLEMNIARHAGWMMERGHNIIVYCINNSSLFHEANNLNIPVRSVPKNKKYFDFINALRIKKYLVKDRMEYVWCRDNRDIGTLGLSKLFSGNKFKLIFQQGMQISIPKKDLIHTIRFKRIDIWLTPLKKLSEEVQKNTRFPIEKIHIVPIGVETKKFYPPAMSKSEARKKLELPDDRKIIGIIGRLDPKKGQLFLIKALSKLHQQNLNYDLLIVGDKTKNHNDDYYNELMDVIHTSDVKNHIHIRPFMLNTQVFYQAIDIFVMASEGETYGMVTIEALVSGLMIAGTKSGGTSEILGNGRYGKLFEPNNIQEFCRIIEQFHNQENESKIMAKQAREYAIKSYSHNYECDTIEDILFNNP